VRIQFILTVFIVSTNLLGIAIALLLVTIVIPVPSVFTDAPMWVTFVAAPAYIALALVLGTFWITRHTVRALRWAIEERKPTHEDQLNTFLAPWRVAKAHLILWGVGTALLTTLYGLQDTRFIPRFLFVGSFAGVVVATACYLLTEFAPYRRNHGQADDRVVSRIAARRRNRAARGVRSLVEEPDPDPIRCRRVDSGGCRATRRLHVDVDRVMAHRDAGARGARRAQSRRAG
jgi:hypothetical protein